MEDQATSTITWYSSHIILTLSQSFPYPNNAKCLARKQQVSILKSLVWLDQNSDLWGSDSHNLPRREMDALLTAGY